MRIIRFISILFLIALFNGCGGGTSGSGLKTYEGNIETTDGRALAGVNITIETTGDSSVTDNSGGFTIKSDAHGHEVPFLLESTEFQNHFILKDIPEDSSRITLTVTVNTRTDTIEVSNIRVRAQFAGLCDFYFENREIIRQSNRVPPDTICSLSVEVLGEGRRLVDVPVALQYASCEANAEWKTLVTTYTGSGEHAGSAEINFEFKDSAEFCRYRVLAPVNGSTFGTYPIDTFTEQEYFGKVKRR